MIREGQVVISSLARERIPTDLQPRQAEIEAIMQTIFQDGVAWLFTQYASRPVPSTRVNSADSSNSGSGFGSDAARRTDESLIREAPAPPEPLAGDGTVDRFFPGVGVDPWNNETYNNFYWPDHFTFTTLGPSGE